MSYTWDQIVTIVRNRQSSNDELLARMIEVKNRYNGDIVMPYPGDTDSSLPTTTPGLIWQAVDFTGMKAASVMPYMNSPAIDAQKETGKDSREFAAIRRKAIAATHHRSRTNLHLRRMYRHLAGYATSTTVVMPDHKREIPEFQLRDPLQTYPEPRAPEDLTPPSNVAVVYAKSSSWILATYGSVRGVRGVVQAPDQSSEELWDLVEWMDEEETVVGILGISDRHRESSRWERDPLVSKNIELRRWPHHMDMCPAYVPRRITLDKVFAQMANLSGQVDLMEQLQALAIAAAEKSIFRDRYIVGRQGTTPTLVGGQWHDGRSGMVNMILDADTIGELSGQPDPSTQMMIDRIERNTRIDSGLVPQAGGETYGALRTGRGMDSLMAAAVDPRVQELQEIGEAALEHANMAMVRCYKGHWGAKKFSMYSGWQGDMGTVTFTPDRHFETDDTVVRYTIPGADVQGTTIVLGQLLGMNAVSMHTMRTRHPYIDDPDAEASRVEEEQLEAAALQSVAQAAIEGKVPPTYVALVEKHRRRNPDIIQAILDADEELRRQQAKVAEMPDDEDADGMFASPDQMPGLAPPGVAPVPPGAPPELVAEMGGGVAPPSPAGPAPGQVGPTGEQEGLMQLMAALSQAPVRQ